MKNLSLSEIVARIRAASAPNNMKTKVVGIDGCGGAGKSTLAQRLALALNAQVIPTDDFASPKVPLDWYDRLITQVLSPLQANCPGRYQRFDWKKGALADWLSVPLQDVIILEGVSSLRQVFRPMLSFGIFVDAPADIRLKRGLARDGVDALLQWQVWQAEENNYLLADDPKRFANVILDGTTPIVA